MNNFCDNEDCIFNSHEVHEEQLEESVMLPNGESFLLTRSVLKFPNGGTKRFCSCCRGAMEMVDDEMVMGESLSYNTPNFCGNDQCWLRTVEVPVDQDELTIQDKETGHEFHTARNYLVYKNGKRKPVCRSCNGAIALKLDVSLWPELSSPIALPEKTKIFLPPSH